MKRKINPRKISSSYDDLIQSSSQNRVSVGLDEKIKEYFQIDVNSILPYKNQGRKIFDEVEIQNLSDTIKLYGVRQPLTVIKSSIIGEFEVISGERRLRAAKLAGLKKVPCIVLQDSENIDEIALIENIQREDLHPIELANSYNSLLIDYKYGDILALAKRLGVSKSHLAEVLSYNKLPEEIKSHLLKNNLRSRSYLRKLMSCKDIDLMKNYLGLSDNNLKKIKEKSLLRICLKGEEMILDIGKWKLTDAEKLKLKETLANFISTI